jgi:hypothetical protein
MKNIYLLFLFIPIFSFSQLRQDSLRNRVWVLGYSNSIQEFSIDYVIFNFNADSVQITGDAIEDGIIFYETNSNISNWDGNLLFLTNGCSVIDSNFNKIQGLEKINNGNYQDNVCENHKGNVWANTTHILPMYPDSIFRIFYNHVSKTDLGSLWSDKLYETKLKRTIDSQIIPIYSDSLVIVDSIYEGNLCSTRHANGRDWWMICPEQLYGYYKLLIKPDTIITQRQSIGLPTIKWEDSTGEACFSPDGSKYARYTISTDVQIFDFDRCSGELSNPLHIPILDAADTIYAAGLAFSPSGRFLYLSSSHYIYQFDMESSNIATSKNTVAVYDGFKIDNLFPTSFYQCELAPDNKIYVSCPGGKESIHVIEHPDSLGLACQVVQHKYILPHPIAGGLPNFPNFHLGPLVGSGCDTIVFTATKEVVAGKELGLNFVLYPNPTDNSLTINLLDNFKLEAKYEIYNSTGKNVGGDRLTSNLTQLSLGTLSDGIYNLVITFGEGQTSIKRFLIIH